MAASDSAHALEQELSEDLILLEHRMIDEEFATELYRALAGSLWRKADGPDGHVSLSWARAEEIVNELRDRVDRPRLTLAQTGREGEVSDLVSGELTALGWTHAPMNTGRADPERLTQPGSPPPPREAGPDWEQQAHEDAERTRLDRSDQPPVAD